MTAYGVVWNIRNMEANVLLHQINWDFRENLLFDNWMIFISTSYIG